MASVTLRETSPRARAGLAGVVPVVARALVVGLIALVAWSVLPLALGWRSEVVLSGSMRPVLSVGDIVVTSPIAPSHVRVGQVVAFHDPAHPGRVLVHRVVDVLPNGTFRTRGDANASIDSTPVPASSVMGVARLRLPHLGLAMVWLRDQAWLALSITALTLFGLIRLSRWKPEVAAAEEERPSDPGRHRRRRRGDSIGRRLSGVSPSMAILVAVCLVSGTAWSAFSGTTSNASNALGAAATFPNYPTTVLGDTPLAYYRCDETSGTTAADASTNANDGNYFGVIQYYGLTGAVTGDNAILVPNFNYAGSYAAWTGTPASYSIEFWFKASASSAGGSIVTDGQTAAQYSSTSFGRMVYLGTDGKIYFIMYNATGPVKKTVSSTSALNDGNWHLVDAVQDTTTGGMYLYIDGTVQNAGGNGYVTAAPLTSGNWKIGGDRPPGTWTATPTRNFDGNVDELAIFNSALTAARVTAHYSNKANFANYTTAVKADSPWGYWHLDDAAPASTSFSTTLADSSGNSHPMTTFYMPSVSLTFSASGALVGSQAASTAIHVTGSGDGSSGITYANPTTFSFDLWFKTNTATGGVLADLGDTTGLPSTNADRALYMDNSGKLYFGVGASGATTISSAAAYNDNAWHYVAATYTSTGMYLYVDGNQVASNTSPGTPMNITGYWRWGGDTLSGWPSNPTNAFFSGYLDEFAAYSSVLSAQQVKWHYGANR